MALAIAGILASGGVISFQVGVVVGALVAAAVELVPMALDDNLTVPILSGVTMSVLGV
ncbi:MAG: hypothetical protein IH986_00560 [Planctomycetes bacterium]|nr:hypothetical protein [Planctomycetota bacterium]